MRPAVPKQDHPVHIPRGGLRDWPHLYQVDHGQGDQPSATSATMPVTVIVQRRLPMFAVTVAVTHW
jgi:hypothetical protein